MTELGAAGLGLLVGGGLVAGIVNTLAGGGSLLTVPLLVLLGVPGVLANGTNRIGILLQCLAAARHFRVQGLLDVRSVARVLAPVILGSLVGALGVARLADETFERIFGVLMLILLVPSLQQLRRPPQPSAAPPRWGTVRTTLVFAAVGLYAGAFQAGVGIPLLFALLHSGFDVVRANGIKVAVIAASALVAIPVFASGDQIAWVPAAALALGFVGGGSLGARLAVRGGERVVRPVLVLAVLALAGHMLGLY
jgi:hypothetical protein